MENTPQSKDPGGAVEKEEDVEYVTAYVMKKPKSAQDWVRRWAVQSSCNGIPNIQRSKSPARLLIWLLIMIAGTAATVLSVYQTVRVYFRYPINVVVTLNLVSSLTFPAITVCNVNPVRKSQLHLGGKDFEENLLRKYQNESAPFQMTFNRSNRVRIREEFDNMYARLDGSIRAVMGHQISDLLLACQYGQEECDASNFTLLPNPYYGNCYTINAGLEGNKLLQSHKPGSRQGLRLEFYLQQEEYVNALTTSAGMRISIHFAETMPFPEDTGLLIAPGFTTQIGLRKAKVLRLPEPYLSKCVSHENKEAKLYNVYSQHYHVDYSEEGCQKTCYQKVVIDQCGCGDPTLPMIGIALGNQESAVPTMPCSSQKEELCERNINDLANEHVLGCNCSVTCSTIKYKSTLSQSIWPNGNMEDYYADTLNLRHPNITFNLQPRRNIARVQVFYSELSEELIEEQRAYTLTNLYSDLGGNIGLYLGLSIIGLFEFIELLMDLLGSVWRNYEHGRKCRKEPPAGCRDTHSNCDVTGGQPVGHQQDANGCKNDAQGGAVRDSLI